MNNLSLIGRLTKDVELRYTTKTNTAVGSFTLAVERDVQKQGEERKADFIPVIAWGKTAEFANKYFSKGIRVAVVGRIQTRTWEDNEKVKHFVTEVVAERVYFADGRKQTEANGSLQSGSNELDSDDELPF